LIIEGNRRAWLRLVAPGRQIADLTVFEIEESPWMLA
jgi:hypothetical protein